MEVHELCAEGDFDALDGIKDVKPNLTVKAVTTPDQVKGCARRERVVRLTKGVPIRAEAVVADGGEFVHDVLLRRGDEAAFYQQVRLVGKGERRFGVFHGSPPRARKRKNPPKLSLLR